MRRRRRFFGASFQPPFPNVDLAYIPGGTCLGTYVGCLKRADERGRYAGVESAGLSAGRVGRVGI